MIIDRYLLSRLLPAVAAIAVVLSAIFATFSLARFLTDASAGVLQISEVFQLTALRWLIAQDVLLPIALYLGLILSWGRLREDLEIDALRAGGLSEFRLLRSAIGLAALLAVFVAFCSLWLRPWAWQAAYAIKAEADASADIQRITSAEFNAYANNRTVFIERIEPDGGLAGIFIRKRSGSDFELLSAPDGEFTAYVTPDTHELRLHQARVFLASGGDPGVLGRIRELTLRIAASRPQAVDDKAKARDTRTLLASADNHDRAELQWRLSAPLSVFLLLATAVPLTRSGPREGRYARLLVAIAVYAVYFNVIGVGRTWVEQGQWRSIVWVHVALLVFAIGVGRYRRVAT
ncbi:MAG: LPS export ABC transporter permease LptF [Chromatocurvus sp.]